MQMTPPVDALLFMQTALGILVATAAIGLVQLVIRFAGKPWPPAWMAMLHGLLAAAAVTLLSFASFTVGLPMMANLALIAFLLAALGGVLLNLGFQWQAKPLPRSIVVLHALVAAGGFVLLLIAVLAAHRG